MEISRKDLALLGEHLVRRTVYSHTAPRCCACLERGPLADAVVSSWCPREGVYPPGWCKSAANIPRCAFDVYAKNLSSSPQDLRRSIQRQSCVLDDIEQDLNIKVTAMGSSPPPATIRSHRFESPQALTVAVHKTRTRL